MVLHISHPLGMKLLGRAVEFIHSDVEPDT